MSASLCSHSRGRCRFVAACLVAGLVAAATADGSSYTLGVSVLENNPDRIVVEYRFPDFVEASVDIDGQKHSQVSLSGEPLTKMRGAPELPHHADSIIIPDDAAMAATVLSSRYYEIQNIDVAPSKGIILRTVNPAAVAYTFGEAYAADAFFPGELVQLGEPYNLRDHRGVVVDVYPLQYNPVQRTLRVYTTMTVEVAPTGTGTINVLSPDRAMHSLSRAFDTVYRSHFINYEPDLRYTPLDETGDMLIIAHDAWIPNVQPLANHKNSIGINTTVVGVSTIGNNWSSIKSYLQSVYNTSDLAFVLLVGDAAQVAHPTASGGASDPTYSKLAGSDNYPDILVGRFSAETAAQVDTQVQRTIEYENMPATQQDWFMRGTGVASNQGPGDDGEYDYQHLNYIRNDLLGYGYTLVDQIYDPSASASQVTAALNAGRGIINYCGHGSTTSWSTTGFSNSHVNSLVNDNMLPFIFSVACVNGQFNGYTCFAEAWLRATNGNEPTGAVGTYMSSINQSWNPPMCAQDEFVDLLVAETYVALGTLCFGGSCQMMDEYGSDGVAMFDTWHVFGDPSLRVIGTVQPPEGLGVTPGDGLNAEGQQGGPFTPNNAQYTLENYNDTPLDYEVTKTVNWLTIANGSGTIPPMSTVAVTVSLTAGANVLGNGEYQDTVSFVNLTDHVGDTSRLVTLTVGVPAAQLAWNLDTNPGWTTEDQWAWGQPLGGGGQYGFSDPTSGHSGANVYGYNLAGDYANYLPERHLTTGAMDCSDLTQVSLRFWRWLGVEQPYYDHASLRASTDGNTWVTVWENGAQVTDSAWTYQQFDLSSIADNQPTVYLRWTMGPTDSGWRYCGWNLDDIELWGLAATPPAMLGDLDCNGVVDFDDINPFVLALSGQSAYEAQYPGCNWLLADCNGDGDVNFDDINAFIALLGG